MLCLSVRSLCSVTCKWTHLAHLHHEDDGSAAAPASAAVADVSDFDHGWSKSFFTSIGLAELVTERFRRLGEGFFCQQIGSRIGEGLSERAAAELGLLPGTVVGVGVIDAHAGGIGVLGGAVDGEVATADDGDSLSGRLAMICGTSTCHMAAVNDAAFVPGVWGPYYSAMVPGLWLLEGGQSSVGSLLDHVIDSHAHGAAVRKRAHEQSASVHDVLHADLMALQKQQALSSFHLLTASLHVLPYHHGNRSPRADSSLLGAVSGLTLSSTEAGLSLLYLATLQSICYADRHIIATLSEHSAPIRRAVLCGGLSKSALFCQCQADVLEVEVVVVDGDVDAMLLGSGMIAAAACGEWGGLRGAMKGMAPKLRLVPGPPPDSDVQRFHSRKYAVFQQMYADQLHYRSLMAGDDGGKG